MSDSPEDFDPESREEREVAAGAATDRSDFLSLMAHTYRGELGRTSSWRTRSDRTTNWPVVVTASMLTEYQGGSPRLQPFTRRCVS
ncbi:hypothetical protein C463_05440 [Halorubrum californiense DSM 19288]|uniref:Uncharacterized protein n=1 Tax=Halorubrum californiense DSM 19288 TaxID=1227465 RepID=M0EG32_9EURY|nr:hypothetical protein C463_05440 [Halorubrum californiense DSM 19288]